MDTIEFILKIENTIVNLGFEYNENYGLYKLGPYVVDIIEDDDNIDSVGIKLMNLNNIESGTNDNYNDVISQTSYFNTKYDLNKELNRRLDAVINKIKNLPEYNVHFRNKKLKILKNNKNGKH